MLEKHYRRKEVETITGLSCPSIYRLMAKGEFPRPIKISTVAVAWPESAISEWLEERRKASLEAA